MARPVLNDVVVHETVDVRPTITCNLGCVHNTVPVLRAYVLAIVETRPVPDLWSRGYGRADAVGPQVGNGTGLDDREDVGAQHGHRVVHAAQVAGDRGPNVDSFVDHDVVEHGSGHVVTGPGRLSRGFSWGADVR